MKKIDLKKVRGSFGFHEWSLDAMAEFETLLKKMISEGLQLASDEYRCHAYFPIEWTDSDGIGGPPPEDPTMVYVALELGEDDTEDVYWSFHLSELIDSLIEIHEHGEGGHIDDQTKPTFLAVAASLRQLADQLDAALARKELE